MRTRLLPWCLAAGGFVIALGVTWRGGVSPPPSFGLPAPRIQMRPVPLPAATTVPPGAAAIIDSNHTGYRTGQQAGPQARSPVLLSHEPAGPEDPDDAQYKAIARPQPLPPASQAPEQSAGQPPIDDSPVVDDLPGRDPDDP